MVYYECQRCGYNTTLRGNIKQHLNRKNICEPILDNISIEEMKEIYNLNENDKIHQITPYTPKLHQIVIKLHQFTPKNTPKKWILSIVLIVCKEFSRRDSLTRHLNRCKKKKKMK